MSKTFRDKLKLDLVLLDGAFGTYIQTLGLRDQDFGPYYGCMEHLVFSRPDLISRLHMDYLDAGADAVETDTFGASSIKLSEYGLAGKVREINMEAVRIARQAADSFSTALVPRYVLGSMGPTGKLPSSLDPSLGNTTYDELKKVFKEQAMALIEGGVDAILVETGQDLLEMKAAVRASREASRDKCRDIIIMAQCTLSNNGRMLLGSEISAVMATLANVGADVVGINCGMGPQEMEGAVKVLSERSPSFISCVPNAGLPEQVEDKVVYPLGPEEMAGQMARFVRQYHLDVVGGCCGTTPEHIRLMKKNVMHPRKRIPPKYFFISSAYRGFDLSMMPRPIKVGERMNTQGSRKTKELLIARDHDGLIELGKSQEKAGAAILDVCATLTERQTEKEDLEDLVSRLRESVTVPLMLDSTDVSVIEAALKKYPGTAFINSANLEDGGEKAKKIFSLAAEHGAYVVCLTIDESGMARTVEKKLEVAGRLLDIAAEFGIPRGRMVFDLLTFTLATGEKEFADSAVNTIEAIKAIKKKYSGVLTILGVSNISFGLAREARGAVNASFLHNAVKAGLDLAIINPSGIPEYLELAPEERKLADALVLSKREDALKSLLDHFALKSPVKPAPVVSNIPSDDLSPGEKLKKCIYERDKSGVIPVVEDLLSSMDPQRIINEVLLEAMKEVGRRLDSGEMVLPYVLQSAEVMRKAIEHLEPLLPKEGGLKKGNIVLATVQGDVHDIGKNLVKVILDNNGFGVLDLGKQVPIETIVSEVKKNPVDAVGLSALLVSTSKHMKTCIRELAKEGLFPPVIIGGAPINEDFASEISILDNGEIYEGGVFYARDAFSGLGIMQDLMDKGGRLRRMEAYRIKLDEYSKKKG
ncbi:MAG: homocysteine S-methyltransferase family protein, partial [Candidatus Omnitrophica bacterium]|nr:homocysteine S-methyltransferase family protein [Candidatus Omnitrophota bacterium]